MILGSRRFLILMLLAAVAMPSFAQRPRRDDEDKNEPSVTYGPKKQGPQGPRAIAVLEWTAKGPRLIPVTIKVDNEFYDASLYMAQPVPMAIDSGVIYEVQKAGEPTGDFTLNSAEQTPSGLWVGLGSFDSKEAQDKRKQNIAKRAAAAAAAKTAEEKAEAGDRPVLRRAQPKPAETPGSTPSATSTSQTPTSPTPAPNSGSTTAQSSTSAPTSAQTSSQPAPAAKPQLTETESDPNRPILKRGKPQQEQASAIMDKTPEKKPVPPPPGVSKVQVAVSDASSTEVHPYKWTWKDQAEEQKLKAQAEKLAQTILADYAAKTGGPKPGELLDVSFQTYDLTYSNAATVIVSARAVPVVAKPAAKRGTTAAKGPASTSAATSGFEYYVTVVGREDIYGQMQKEFAVASDNKHLDAFPKMQLVDVVDADGKGAGDLLFQSTSDRGDSFVIYRDMGWSLQEVIKVPEPKA